MRVIRELLILEDQSSNGRLLGTWSPDCENFVKVEVFMRKDIYVKGYLHKGIVMPLQVVP